MKKLFNVRNRYILIGDLILIILAVFGSFVLRVELLGVFYNYFFSLIWMIGISLIAKPLIYYFFGLYRRMWLYASIRELRLIILAVTIASAVSSSTMLVLYYYRIFTAFPRSVLVIDWVLSLIFAGGLRFSMRLLAETKNRPLPFNLDNLKKTLIIGAGDAGALVANEVIKNPQINLNPVGFLDDDQEKLHQQIHGIPIIGQIKDLEKIISEIGIQEVIIAIPSAPGAVIRDVIDVCRRKSIHFRTMPGLYELLDGKVSISKLRDVEIADLLRRAPVQMDKKNIREYIIGKVILVTGAGGSIGSELCRQIIQWNPKKLVLLGHGENSIFETYLEMREIEQKVQINAVIADIRNIKRIEKEFARHKPDIVFHAAAHKHVPLMENNISECVLNNILGTRNIVEVCATQDIQRLILISTDKAVRPVSIMGASKRISELLVLHEARKNARQYSVVRFGNVLGSRGSVVPLFKRQIASGGPITVTHPDMKRYFMTIPEAVHLVLQAASMGQGGETFILNMGEQIRITDLAEDLIRLSGLTPGKDIEIVFTGIREGEKLSEDLWDQDHDYVDTSHPDILSDAGGQGFEINNFEAIIQQLIEYANNGDSGQIISAINNLLPDADLIESEISDLTTVS